MKRRSSGTPPVGLLHIFLKIKLYDRSESHHPSISIGLIFTKYEIEDDGPSIHLLISESALLEEPWSRLGIGILLQRGKVKSISGERVIWCVKQLTASRPKTYDLLCPVRWLHEILARGSSQVIAISSPGLNSLKRAILPNSSTSSMTRSSLATVSTSNEAKAVNGRASENSRLVIAILLSCGLIGFITLPSLGWNCEALLDFHSVMADVSDLTVCTDTNDPPVSAPRKSRGWVFSAVFRSCRASWSRSERISGDQFWRFLMLLASSIRTLDTSPASRMHGCLNSRRTDSGV